MRKRFSFILALLLFLIPSVLQAGGWTATATVAQSGTTSTAVTIPRGLSQVGVIIPTLDTGTCTVQVSYDGTTYYGYYYLAGAAAAPAALVTGSGTHNYATALPDAITAFNYVRFVVASQTSAARTLRMVGQYK